MASGVIMALLGPLGGVAEASPWVEDPGTVQLGLQGSLLVTERQFAGGDALGLVGPRCPEPVRPGDRAPYDCTTGGTYAQRSLTAFTQAGLGAGFALDLQVPAVVASFEDTIGRTDAFDLGDVRGRLRWGSQWGSPAAALTFHVKAPTGVGDFQDRDVPLGDGQWDLTPGMRLGVSLHPWGWIEVWQSLSIRLPNPQTGIDFGDEWRPVVAAGFTPIDEVGGLLRVEGLLALRDRDAFGLRPPGRQLLQLRSSIFARPVPAAWLELGVAVPVAGRRWPAALAPYATLMWTR